MILLIAAPFVLASAYGQANRVAPDATFDEWFRSLEHTSPEWFARFMYSSTTHPSDYSQRGGSSCVNLLAVRHLRTERLRDFEELPYYLEWSIGQQYLSPEELSPDMPIYEVALVTCVDPGDGDRISEFVVDLLWSPGPNGRRYWPGCIRLDPARPIARCHPLGMERPEPPEVETVILPPRPRP